MKNKIRCLFDKITSEDLLGIFGICICALLIFTMVFAPISANAYANYPYTVTLTNPKSLPINGFINLVYYNEGYQSVNALGTHTLTQNVEDTVYTVTNSRTENDVHIFDITADGTTLEIIGDIPNGSYIIDYYFVTNDSSIVIEPINVQYSGGGIIEDPIEGDIGIYFLLNVDNNFVVNEVDVNLGVIQQYMILRPVGDLPPTQCPTLEDQIANYNGSWTDFLMLLRQNNRNLANSYQNNIELAIQSGFQSGANSVTLEQRLSEFDGNWQDFERLMAEYNVDLQTMYTNYVNSLETQAFEDGNAYGQEIGYKNGYNSGLNKGQSDTFTKNFFTDFLGGVVEAIDSIHLYEHIREIDGALTVVEWYISPWTIFTSMICLIVVIIILKVWLGG